MINLINKTVSFLKARFAPRGARLSFSQAGEDIVINNIFSKLGINKISYIDIGAHDPVFGNVTYLFYKQGGSGILIEPNNELCEKIRTKRPKDICLNAGAGGVDGEAGFYEFERSTRSTFSKEQAEEWEKLSGQKPKIEKKQIISLDSIINKYFVDNIPDLVSIDAEGLDFEILKGFSFSKRPKVFCVESTGEMNEFMQNKGYKLESQILHNYIFIDNKI